MPTPTPQSSPPERLHCHCLCVLTRGSDIPSHARELAQHFQTQVGTLNMRPIRSSLVHCSPQTACMILDVSCADALDGCDPDAWLMLCGCAAMCTRGHRL
jgi:hypothetical protein